MAVRTRAVGAKIIGDARKTFESAAGPNAILSKTEQRKLPRDLAAAAQKAREANPVVTVDDAVDVYAEKVSYVLKTVDKTGRGYLSETEVHKIKDPALRKKAIDVRAALAQPATPPPPPPPPASGAGAQAVASLADAINGVSPWWDSGDNGVNVSISALVGKKSLASAMAHVPGEAPWTGAEGNLVLASQRGAAALTLFEGEARAALESFKDDDPEAIQAFIDQAHSTFSALSSVRVARGQDLGGLYLLGRAADGYVGLVVQPYSDG